MEQEPRDLQVKYQPGNFPKKNWRAYLPSSFKVLEQAFPGLSVDEAWSVHWENGLPISPLLFICLERPWVGLGRTEGENPSRFLLL